MPGDSTKSMSLQNYKNKCLSAARQLLKSIALWAGLPACLHPLVLSILRCLACMTYRRSAVERAESARQRLVLVGQGATSFHLLCKLPQQTRNNNKRQHNNSRMEQKLFGEQRMAMVCCNQSNRFQ